MKLFSFLSGSVLLIFLCISCTGSTKELATSSSSSGNFPSWYSSNGFSTDTLAFYGYGVAIAADSTDALERATIDAQNKLSYQLGKMAEDIRLQMDRENSSVSKNTDFILLLRNSHSSTASYSEVKNSFLITPDTGYRALVQISLSKAKARQMFQSGFEGHPRYWAAFSGSSGYHNLFQD